MRKCEVILGRLEVSDGKLHVSSRIGVKAAKHQAHSNGLLGFGYIFPFFSLCLGRPMWTPWQTGQPMMCSWG